MFTYENKNKAAHEDNLLQKKSFYNIYRSKCYNFLENRDLLDQARFIFKFSLSIWIIIFLAYPDVWLNYLKKIFMFQNMLIPKSFVTFYIIYNIWSIYKNYTYIKKMVTKSIKSFTSNKICKQNIQENKEKLISWIPIIEILNHLFENKHFKRTEVEWKFWISRNKYQQLAAKLEDINILKRGENNSRVLNEEYTREQIAKAFIFADGDIRKMYMPVIQEGNNYTREWQGPALTDKMNELTDNITTA